jgi:hypothetical protein
MAVAKAPKSTVNWGNNQPIHILYDTLSRNKKFHNYMSDS